jgi:Tfp pilus assembly protein PilN
MINLLPPEYAASIRYGRQNSKLIVWLGGLLGSIVVLAIILAAGWIYMNQEGQDLQKGIDATNQQLQEQNLSKVQADAKEITGDINVIDKVLSQEIQFSGLIQSIGSYMPPGAVLGTLSLSDKVTGSIDLSANTKDYASAAQVAVNLSDPKDELFSKVDIINISCDSAAEKAYKCSATFRALFSKTAQTKFLSVPVGSKS